MAACCIVMGDIDDCCIAIARCDMVGICNSGLVYEYMGAAWRIHVYLFIGMVEMGDCCTGISCCNPKGADSFKDSMLSLLLHLVSP